MSEISKEGLNQMIGVNEKAFNEFHRDGKVTTAHCHVCDGLIEIRALDSSAEGSPESLE